MANFEIVVLIFIIVMHSVVFIGPVVAGILFLRQETKQRKKEIDDKNF